jgi:hypothetical protein
MCYTNGDITSMYCGVWTSTLRCNGTSTVELKEVPGTTGSTTTGDGGNVQSATVVGERFASLALSTSSSVTYRSCQLPVPVACTLLEHV